MVPTPARPLRALGVALALWVIGRGMFVWAEIEPMAKVAMSSGGGVPQALAARDTTTVARSIVSFSAPAAASARRFETLMSHPTPTMVVVHHLGNATQPPAQPEKARLMMTEAAAPAAMTIAEDSPGGGPRWLPTPMPDPLAQRTPAWSGSLWIAARDGSAGALAAGNGQLGGSQAGTRLYRNLSPALALTGRLSTALAAKGQEASLGVALRRGSLAMLAERRIALDSGGRNDWSVTAVAGISDVPLPSGIRLDGYVQAGIVGRDGFADGALRLERTVMGSGSERLAIGAGGWGSVQSGLARLDVGPQIVVRTALAGRAVRLSADWRQRIAGNAAPGSGPVVTLGTDF